MVLAGLFAAANNLTMRRSLDRGGTVGAFLAIQMSVAVGAALLLGPGRAGAFQFNLPIALFGLLVGSLLGLMLKLIGKALQQGPPGLTFAILNGATVFPALLMTLFFAYPYTPWHAFGSLFVIAGLLWAGRGGAGTVDKKKWALFVCLMFLCHIVILFLFQTRAYLMSLPHPEEIISFFSALEIQSVSFMTFYYLGAALFVLTSFLIQEARLPSKGEWANGFLGGVANAMITFFMIASTEAATPLEGAIIFPLFSIVGILGNNLWGQRLYQEQVNWRACQVCLFGILVGTVDWPGLLQSF